MKLPDDFPYPYGIIFDIPDSSESAEDQCVIESLRCEIAYLKGKIAVYEKFLKDKGFIKEEE